MCIRGCCVLLIAFAGCRGAADQDIDSLITAGIVVQRNATGEVFLVDTSGRSLDEHFWKTLSSFDQLEQLSLTGSPVTDTDLARVVSLRTLQSLDLSYTRVTHSGLHILSRMEDLRTLSLNGVRLNHAAVESLSPLTRLRSLSLIDTGLNATDGAALQESLTGCLVVL